MSSNNHKAEEEQLLYQQKFSNDILYSFMCSNKNRVAILYLLGKEKEMNAESISNKLGITHRTTLYHLNILAECELVEVRRFKKKGTKKLRSVWGIKNGNKEVVENLFSKIEKNFNKDELDGLININIARR